MKSLNNFVYFLGISLGWAIFGWQLLSGVRKIIQNQITFNAPTLLLISLAIMLIYIGVQTWNWHLILAGLGVKLRWLDISTGYSFSSIARYIPGTVWGYFSRSEWLFRQYEIPYKQSGTASIIEVLASVASAFLVLGILGLIDPKIPQGGWIVGAIFLPLIVWVLILRISNNDHLKFFKKIISNPIMKFPIKVWFITQFIFVVQWMIYGIITWLTICASQGFNPLTNNIGFEFLDATYAFTLAWVIGFLIPIIPGGIGIREAILVLLLSDFFKMSADQCALIAISLRIMYAIAELAWAAWGLKRTKHIKFRNRWSSTK
jgi:glycosyltransferase 2 family protein